MHTTNTPDTLVTPAEDCAAVTKVPEREGSVAAMQFAMLQGAPYARTSDEVLSGVAADRKGVGGAERDAFLAAWASKGQPCFRASPLTKTHGWAVHSDAEGRVALVDPNGPEFERLMADDAVTKVAAMRSRRA